MLRGIQKERGNNGPVLPCRTNSFANSFSDVTARWETTFRRWMRARATAPAAGLEGGGRGMHAIVRLRTTRCRPCFASQFFRKRTSLPLVPRSFLLLPLCLFDIGGEGSIAKFSGVMTPLSRPQSGWNQTPWTLFKRKIDLESRPSKLESNSWYLE